MFVRSATTWSEQALLARKEMSPPTEKDSSGLPRDRLWQPVTIRWFAVAFGLSLGYAILRYHIAGDVAWDHFPLFILNKVTSLAAGRSP